MGENDVTNVSKNKSIFNVKNIMRVLSLLCIVFVFCPSFLVSCSGQTMNVSVMTAVEGVTLYGEKVVEPHIIMLVCLLIPIAVLFLLFIKKLSEKKNAAIILGCMAVDFVIWFIFRMTVKKMAEDSYCTFKTTAWYVINIIVMLILILLSALVVLKKIEMDTDLITMFSGDKAQGALNQMNTTVNQMSNVVTQFAGNIKANVNNTVQKEKPIGFCSKCGGPISYGCKFCTSCGTPVPESMLAEAEVAKKAAEEAARKAAEEAARRAAEDAARKEAEERARRIEEEEKRKAEARMAEQNNNRAVFCHNCGARLEADAVFCKNCGTKAN